MKEFLSRLLAELRTLQYEGSYVVYHHINQKGYWEYSIETIFGTVYKTKGLRNEK